MNELSRPEVRNWKNSDVLAGMTDLQIAQELRREKFQGTLSEWAMADLWIYAARILTAWSRSGEIFNQCMRIGWPVKRSAIVEGNAETLDELVQEAVSSAFLRFKRNILDRNWDSQAGASLGTYFVHGCVAEFPNAYRRTRTYLLTAGSATVVEPEVILREADSITAKTRYKSFHTWWSENEEVAAALQEKSPLLKHILGYMAEGYTARETAVRLGATTRSVEAHLLRFRTAVRNVPDDLDSRSARHSAGHPLTSSRFDLHPSAPLWDSRGSNTRPSRKRRRHSA